MGTFVGLELPHEVYEMERLFPELHIPVYAYRHEVLVLGRAEDWLARSTQVYYVFVHVALFVEFR